MTVLAAAKLVQTIVGQIPEGDEEVLMPLIEFCRVACTTNGTGSEAAAAWETVDTARTDDILEGCIMTAQTGAPQGAAAPNAPAPPNDLRAYASIVSTAITESQRNAEDRAKRSKFSSLALESFAGMTEMEDLDCNSSILTPFFQGLEEHRGNKVSAHVYVEKQLGPKAATDPEAPIAMTTVFSTETITAIRNIDAIAEDTIVSWDERHKGISIFNLAPAPTHLVHQAKVGRMKCMQFENAAFEKQDDIRRASAVSTSVEEWPMTHDRLRAWILTFRRHTLKMFGRSFIVLPLMDKLLLAMQVEMNWMAIDSIACMTITWAVHKGIRLALGPLKDTSYLRDVVRAFALGKAPSARDMGPDIAARIATAAPNSDAARAPQSGNSWVPTSDEWGSGKRPRGQQTSRDTRQKTSDFGNPVDGPAFTKSWASDLQAVRDMMGGKLRGRDFCAEVKAMDDLFGSGFRGLMPIDKRIPCMSYFIFGRCHDKCARSHTTTKPPDQPMLDGLQARVRAQCQQLLAKKA
jgi:hypothetical protein